jgi:SAM-dependent methyltransferase
VATRLSNQDVAGKRVLEIGSFDVNGTTRKCIEFWQPAEYVGVDIQEGPGVDLVCDAEKLMDIFSEESFDVVFSTELLEHVLNPKTVISNMKRLCKRNGAILLRRVHTVLCFIHFLVIFGDLNSQICAASFPTVK